MTTDRMTPWYLLEQEAGEFLGPDNADVCEVNEADGGDHMEAILDLFSDPQEIGHNRQGLASYLSVSAPRSDATGYDRNEVLLCLEIRDLTAYYRAGGVELDDLQDVFSLDITSPGELLEPNFLDSLESRLSPTRPLPGCPDREAQLQAQLVMALARLANRLHHIREMERQATPDDGERSRLERCGGCGDVIEDTAPDGRCPVCSAVSRCVYQIGALIGATDETDPNNDIEATVWKLIREVRA